MTSDIHRSLYNFSKDLVGEDILIKYMLQNKIDTFDSSTPVSIRLLSGRNNFKKCLSKKHSKKSKKKQKTSCKLPIIYHNLNKLKNISNEINEDSELPIGVLMLNNNIFTSTNTNTLDFKDYLKLNLTIKQIKFLRNTFGNIAISPVTLVPLKLICKKKCLFLDDPLLQEYLTLIDLPKSALNNDTMIPLGLLLIMKKLYY